MTPPETAGKKRRGRPNVSATPGQVSHLRTQGVFLAPNPESAEDRHRDGYASFRQVPSSDEGIPTEYPRDDPPIPRERNITR